MKRHNAKAIAAAVAIAAAAATAEVKKKTSEPTTTKTSLNTSTLYVDVVKNMAKMESSPSVTPPPPKFTILHEDFPALPGTPEDLHVGISGVVPDDWTAMISDDDDEDDDDVDVDGDNDADVDDDDEDDLPSPIPSLSVLSIADPETVPVPDLVVGLELESCTESSQSSAESSEQQDTELTSAAATVALVAATTDSKYTIPPATEPNYYEMNTANDSNNSIGIFDVKFIIAGVAQRAWRRQKSNESKFNSQLNIGPPPGFENLKFYGRMRTNRMGVPLGGVTFDMAATPPPPAPPTTPPPPPPSSKQKSSNSGRWHKPNVSLEGAYGLAGLANNLKAAQKNPHMLAQMLGHDAAGLKVDAHCCACEANKMHASFAGPLNGGRCGPHEVNFDVPLYYRRSGGQDLQQPKIEQMQEELLFFFFYTYPGDMMQMLAAAELADRGWRFHIYERLWLRPQKDNPHYVKRGFQESGEYNYFNMVHWKILARHFFLHPEQVERTITKAELLDQYGYHPQMSFF